MLLISCPKEETEPETENEVLAEADIGPAGAVLEADGIILTVPPEAFSSTFTIQIAREEEFDEDFGESAASPAFRISGFPTETFKSVSIAIHYQVNLESDTYLAIGGIDYLNEEKIPLARCALPDNGKVPLERYFRVLKMKINISKTSLEGLFEEKLRSYAYLWVYRMIYYMYFGDRLDWFAYASAFWMQEYHTGTSDYSTGMFNIVGRSPFIGLEDGKEAYPFKREIKIMYGGTIDRNVELHGYGMFPFIKYLGQRYADDMELIIKMMKEMLLGGGLTATEAITPAEAIINVLEEPEYLLWPGFFEKYLTRKLVDVSAGEFLQLFPEAKYQVEFPTEKDTSILNGDNYDDLSARLLNISFLFPSFQNEASLNLMVGPSSINFDYVTAMAFGLKNDQLECLNQASDLTIENLKALTESGTVSIPVVVVNSINGPNPEKTAIELESILKTAPQVFSGVDVTVICGTNYADFNGDLHETYFNYYIADPPYTGVNFQNRFTAEWENYLDPWTYSGTIEVEFDPDNYPNYITRFTVTDSREASYSELFTITGENIELKEYNFPLSNLHYYKFSVYGTDVCNYVTSAREVLTGSDGEISHVGTGEPICNAESIFEIVLYCD